jgi:hypothetical protein
MTTDTFYGRYRHTQPGVLMLQMLLGLAALFLVLGLFTHKAIFLLFPILLVFTAWIFRSLTVEIDERELRWHFGSGLIHKSAALAEIVSARPVRTNLMEGWGIHMSRYGWLYNVSGFDAVAVTLRSGKRFAIGTDEPQVLAMWLAASQRP